MNYKDGTILECSVEKKNPYSMSSIFYTRIEGKNCRLLTRRNRYGYDDYCVTTGLIPTSEVFKYYTTKPAPKFDVNGI